MHTRKGTPEDYIGSYASIEVFGSGDLKAPNGKRTGIESISGKAVYQLTDWSNKPVSDVLYIIDNQQLVPVKEYRAARMPKSAMQQRAEANEEYEYAFEYNLTAEGM